MHTRYAPVRRSLIPKNYTPRLACVKPAASVHPEPGSNSSSYIMRNKLLCLYLFLTEDLSVYSNLSILLLSILCLEIALKTAVNSICLGTCLIFLFRLVTTLTVSLQADAKIQLLFNLASTF